MALIEGWKRRLDGWQKAIIASVCRPFGYVAVEGFAATEKLTPQQAGTREFHPMPRKFPMPSPLLSRKLRG